MTTFKDMDKMHDTYLKDLENVKQALIDIVLTMPDNPKINRINDQCYTISSANLSSDLCLSPEYYNFKLQYRLIVEIIENNTIKKIQKLLNDIIHKGSIHYPTSARTYHRFHPDVVEHLKTLMG